MALLEVGGADWAMHARGVVEGALFMVRSPLALVGAVAGVLAVDAGHRRRVLLASGLYVLAAVASTAMPPNRASGAAAPGVILVLGLLLALGLRLRGAAGWFALVMAGVASGVGGGLQTATWQETLGGLSILFFVMLFGELLGATLVVPARFSRGAITARRMAGAWIAAVGTLLLALWLRRGG